MNSRRYLSYLDYTSLFRLVGDNESVMVRLKQRFLSPSYIHTHWRLKCLYSLSKKSLIFKPFFLLCTLRYRQISIKFGIDIPPSTKIGKGFYIGHHGSIVISGNAVIGDNCNISQGVTIGQVNRGPRKGFPVLGNNVYVGPGAKIIGNVRIGDNVAIGANAVVTHDVPNNAVVVGVPSRIISYAGSVGYINRTNYKTYEEWSEKR